MEIKNNNTKHPSASNSAYPESVLTPPTQPLPKGSKSHTNISTDPKNTKDSDPTQ